VQFAGVIGGGLAPLIATKLLSVGDGSPHLIITYIMGMAIFAIFCTFFMKRDKFNIQASKVMIKNATETDLSSP
jgi:type II secretory pathway component PulF